MEVAKEASPPRRGKQCSTCWGRDRWCPRRLEFTHKGVCPRCGGWRAFRRLLCSLCRLGETTPKVWRCKTCGAVKRKFAKSCYGCKELQRSFRRKKKVCRICNRLTMPLTTRFQELGICPTCCTCGREKTHKARRCASCAAAQPRKRFGEFKLRVLDELDVQSMPSRELATALGISLRHVLRLCHTLLKEGKVRRRIDEDDRFIAIWSLAR